MDSALLADIVEYSRSLNPGDALSPKALRAIAGHAGASPIRHSAETGTGGSTLLFSHLSASHTVFALDNETLQSVRAARLLKTGTTTFIEGPTQRTLPLFAFPWKLQAVLLDGPHGFPFPQLEYFYLYPHLEPGALLIVDDIHIRSIHDLYRFLRRDAMFTPVEVVGTTAFFRRTEAPLFDSLGDGWWLQGYNRRVLLRYRWKDALRAAAPAPVRRALKQALAPRNAEIDEPAPGASVGAVATVRGRAHLAPDTFLWLFAHRADIHGWWPQGGSAIQVSAGQWERTCHFGEPQDAGHEFEIAVMIVDAAADARLRAWVEEGARTGTYPPLQLPAGRPVLRRVVRT